MKQITQNTFNKAMNKDLNPLTTPNDVLTDALNATIITYNGTEFVLQNDMGNCKVERAKLPPGYIPIGMQEYGGIVYVASHNPETGLDEIGCFPSPERDFSTTDFANISPAHFQTSDFVVATVGNETEKLSKVEKLSEPELLQLSPGDKYLVVYTINDSEPGTSLPDDIDTEVKMNNYISKSSVARKLFKLKFYKISDSNLVELDPVTIKTMVDGIIDDEDYAYFTETSKATLAVGLELETLDLFDSNVIDTSSRIDVNKKFVIEAVAYSDSLNTFEGVKVELLQPSAETFYIDKTGLGNKVSAEVSGLAALDHIKGKITPYSNYMLFPKLMQTFDFKLAAPLSNGTDTTNIYKFQKVGKFMRVEFDYKFEGDTGVDLFMEFYDPWSDVSTISVVDSPTYFGLNTVTVELVNEPRTSVFNDITKGGVLVSGLSTDVDPYYKHILSTSGYVRKNQLLRDNHFYVVRIVGVETIDVLGVDTTVWYDVYRGLYTSDLFNQDYADSANWSIDDVRQDFNNLPFKYTNIGFDANLDKRLNNAIVETDVTTTLVSDAENYQQFVVQDNKQRYGVISDDPDYIVANGSNILYGKKYDKTAKDVLQIVPRVSKVFGNLKESGLSVTVTNPSNTLVDDGYNSVMALSPDSTYGLAIDKVSEKYFNLNHSLTTYRKLQGAPVKYGPTPGNLNPSAGGRLKLALPVLKTASLQPILGVNLDEDSADRKLSITGTANNGATYAFTGTNNAIDDTTAFTDLNTFEAAQGIEPTGYFSKFTGETWRLTDNTCCEDTSKDRASVDGQFTSGFVVIKTKDNKAWIWNKNVTVIEKFLNSVEVGYKINTDLYVYTVNTGTLKKHDDIRTFGAHTISIGITLAAVGSLFEFYFKAQNATVDFKASVFNDYIVTRATGSTVLDGTLEANFFPITGISDTVVKVLDPIEINKDFDDTLGNAIINAQADILQSNVFNVAANTDTHGQLYIKDGSGDYTQLLPFFEVRPAFFSGATPIAVDPADVHLVIGKEDSQITRRNFMLKKGGNWGKDKLHANSNVMDEILDLTLNNIT